MTNDSKEWLKELSSICDDGTTYVEANSIVKSEYECLQTEEDEWWFEDRFYYEGSDGTCTNMPAIIAESRSRFKEEVLKALEGRKGFIYKSGSVGFSTSNPLSRAAIIQDAIETIKKL